MNNQPNASSETVVDKERAPTEHSKLGITSVVIFLAVVVIVVGWVLLYKDPPRLVGAGPQSAYSSARSWTALGVGVASTVGSVVGFALGLAGWLGKGRIKTFPVVGTVANGIIVACLLLAGGFAIFIFLAASTEPPSKGGFM